MSSEFVGWSVAQVEREHIMETLRRCSGNRTHAAKALGISIRTLRNRIAAFKAMGVSVPTNGFDREDEQSRLPCQEHSGYES